MELKSFRIQNFRSIYDSGDINVERITALLGRNESGKSNLLRALHSLNPVEGFRPLNPIKDFPRQRRLEECTDETPVVDSTWALSSEEQAKLTAILPQASSVELVTISRRYGQERSVLLLDYAATAFDETDIRAKLRKIPPAVRAAAQQVPPSQSVLEKAADAFENWRASSQDRVVWATEANATFKTLRTALAAAEAELTPSAEHLLTELEELAASIASEKGALAKAENFILEWMPKFIFLEEYPQLDGHQNISQYLDRKTKNQPSSADLNFDKLCKVAGLDPAELQRLHATGDQETRNQLVNRAGAVVTAEIRRLWKDRPLKIRFNLDAQFLDTLVSDPNAIYDVEVNLNERSRGFLWFFSFYITFSADTDGGRAANAILLLDEPGLYLHARSQADLLHHFRTDYSNQILFTTHSPFMVPTQNLEWVRTVNIEEQAGTTVSNDPSGDSRTLFPLQAALGYDLVQSMFVGPNNLVIEGVTDFWVLSTVSEYLKSRGGKGLDAGLTLTPAGGAPKVSYMVALLSSERLNVLVLLDTERDASRTAKELVKAKLIREQNVFFVSDAFDSGEPSEADVEDLLPPDTYERLVRESYAKELAGVTLNLNSSIPRIAKRFEVAFEEAGLTFLKTRPARLLLTQMADRPDDVLDAQAVRRFEMLFSKINARLDVLNTSETRAFV